VNRKVEIQVGLTVLAALLILLLGVTWLKDFSLRDHTTVWHVRFPQTGGLGASDEVQVNGVEKGAVTRIQLQGDHVLVDLGLESDVKLTAGSRIAIRNVGLMGEKVIAVDLGVPGPLRSPRDTIAGVYELGIPEVVANMGGTFTAVDQLASELGQLAADVRTSGDLHAALVDLRETSRELHGAVTENRRQLREAVANADAVTGTLRRLTTDREAQYQRTLDAAERTTHNLEVLSARLDSLRATAQSVGNKLDHGDGTAARLLNDARLYDDTRAALQSMRALLDDLKQHPKKYINLHVF
jgi:phospholipid/cholesterol/gamma-HCH transport system substrate-binding protein